MSYHQTLLRNLEQWGLLDFILPVLLIFTSTFAILQKLQIFKEKQGTTDVVNKKVNLILALGISLVAVSPHFTGQGPDIIVILANMLPQSFVVLLAFLLCLALTPLMTDKKAPKENPLIGILVLVAFAALIAIILQAGGFITLPFLFLIDPNTLSIVIILIVFALVVWYIGKKDKPAPQPGQPPSEPFKNFKEVLQKLIGD